MVVLGPEGRRRIHRSTGTPSLRGRRRDLAPKNAEGGTNNLTRVRVRGDPLGEWGGWVKPAFGGTIKKTSFLSGGGERRHFMTDPEKDKKENLQKLEKGPDKINTCRAGDAHSNAFKTLLAWGLRPLKRHSKRLNKRELEEI